MCGRWNKKNALKRIYVYVLCKLELNTTKSNKKQQQKRNPKLLPKPHHSDAFHLPRKLKYLYFSSKKM